MCLRAYAIFTYNFRIGLMYVNLMTIVASWAGRCSFQTDTAKFSTEFRQTVIFNRRNYMCSKFLFCF